MSAIKVMLVDSLQLVMEGIKQVLEHYSEFTIIATALDGITALTHLKSQIPDIVLMEIHMPRLGGIETCKIITRDYPQVQVVILTSCYDSMYISDAFRVGAKGYLSKNISPQELIRAVHTIHREGTLIPPSASTHAFHSISQKKGPNTEPTQHLTAKEREILFLVVEGQTTDEIAQFLFISPKTVRNHLSHIYEKLGTRDRLQTILYMKQVFL